MWQGAAPWRRLRRCTAPPHRGAGARSTLLGAALVVALDSHAAAAASRRRRAGPSVLGGVAAAPARSPTTPRSAPPTSARGGGPQPRALRQEPGGVVASAAAHGALAAAGRPRRAAPPASTPTRSRRSSCSRAPGAPDARASDDLRAAVGPDADPGRDRPEPARHADRRRGSERLDARHRCAGAACASARRVRRRVDERFDPAKALAATARYLRLAKGKLGRDDLAVVAYHMGVGNLQQALDRLRRGRHPLRPALLRLEPAAPRGGVAEARLARRRLLDLPVARARGAGDHAPVSQRPGGAAARGGAAGAQGLGRGGPAPARAHDGLRRPLRDRPRAGVGRRCARSTRTVLAPTACAIDPRMGELARARRAVAARCTARCARRRCAVLEAIGAGDAGDRGQRAAGRHEHGARQATTSTCWRRPTRRRRTATRSTPPATPSTSRAPTAAAPRRSPSSSCSTA